MTTAKEFYDNFDSNIVRILQHDSPEEYVEFLDNPTIAGLYKLPKHGLSSDFAGLPYHDAVDKVRFGDDARAILAEKIMQDVMASDIQTPGRPEIIPAIVGSIPNVPALLAGQPETMLTRSLTDAYSSSAAIRIFLDVGISEGVTQAQLIKRGVAALAFTLVMKQIRPIELYTVIGYQPLPSPGNFSSYNVNSAAIHIVRVETNPLDLSRAAWMLTDPAYARRLSFHTSIYMTNDINKLAPGEHQGIKWAFNMYPENDDYVNKMREVIKLNPQDVFIKGGSLTDKLMLDKPVEWINKMIEENRHLTELDNEWMEGVRAMTNI